MKTIESNVERLPKHMNQRTVIVHEIRPDEKAMALHEVNLGTDFLGHHRVQIIYVERGGTLGRWVHRLGPASAFTAPQLSIPSLWEHTVAELQAMAEEERLGSDYWRKYALEKRAESTLITDFISMKEEAGKQIRNQTVIGPGITIQRDNFSRAAFKERQHGSTA